MRRDPRLRGKDAPWEAERPGGGAGWGHGAGTKEGRAGSDAQGHTPPPSSLFPPTVPRGSTAGFSSQDRSFFFIHLFQRASSKQVYSGRRKEMTAHNRHADSLSLQSSLVKHGGRGGREGGERSSRKNKNSSACARGSGGGRSSAARAPSAWLRPRKRGAAAPPSGRAERRTRLVGRGGDPGPGAGGQAPALPTTARGSQRGRGDPQGSPAVQRELHSRSSSFSWPGSPAR